MKEQYIAIDLKSFYASVECIERGLDPMTTNLVVADASRTEKKNAMSARGGWDKNGYFYTSKSTGFSQYRI